MMFASYYRIPVIEVSVIGYALLCFSFVVHVSVACLLLLVSFVLFALSFLSFPLSLSIPSLSMTSDPEECIVHSIRQEHRLAILVNLTKSSGRDGVMLLSF